MLSADRLFTFICHSRTRGHSFKLFYRIQGLIVENIFFAVRVLRIWNSLHEEVVSADHLSLLIRRLERVKLNQFLIGKIQMLLRVLFLYF